MNTNDIIAKGVEEARVKGLVFAGTHENKSATEWLEDLCTRVASAEREQVLEKVASFVNDWDEGDTKYMLKSLSPLPDNKSEV